MTESMWERMARARRWRAFWRGFCHGFAAPAFLIEALIAKRSRTTTPET